MEPTGPFEDDPNLTDKKFPGNPMRSYRTQQPLRITGEVLDWEGHSPETLQAMRDHLEELKRLGIEAINDSPTAQRQNECVGSPESTRSGNEDAERMARRVC